MTEVKAEVPMAEMLTYAPDLRSLTGGQGDYTMEFLRYEEVPAHLAQKVVARRARGGRDGLTPRCAGAPARAPLATLACAMTPADRHEPGRRLLRRLRPHAAARRARRVFLHAGAAPHGLRAVHRRAPPTRAGSASGADDMPGCAARPRERGSLFGRLRGAATREPPERRGRRGAAADEPRRPCCPTATSTTDLVAERRARPRRAAPSRRPSPRASRATCTRCRRTPT